MTSRSLRRGATTLGAAMVLAVPSALAQTPQRPFGTLREQAALQQQWLAKRLDTVLPALMRKYRVDMWLIPMREYNEDPTFSSLVSPTTFAARRRTIYVFYDRGPARCRAASPRRLQPGWSRPFKVTAEHRYSKPSV